MTSWYEHWHSNDVVESFARKSTRDFFQTEVALLRRISRPITSVLDVGCASGHFFQLVRERWPMTKYVGIDLSPASIDNARNLYPEGRFIAGNALAVALPNTFDLVNATGVFQHEPAWEQLLTRMVRWSTCYTLFDVKIAAVDDHLVDRDKAYCEHDSPLYFIILSFPRLLGLLRTLPGIARAHVYGYVTPTNAVTVIPEALDPIVSAGVLLERGFSKGPTQINVTLPEFIPRRLDE